jgi:hypothetical protein
LYFGKWNFGGKNLLGNRVNLLCKGGFSINQYNFKPNMDSKVLFQGIIIMGLYVALNHIKVIKGLKFQGIAPRRRNRKSV